MASFDDSAQARKVAAVVAAVQAYLDGETRTGGRERGGMSAWRRNATLIAYDDFGARRRSWTGRDRG